MIYALTEKESETLNKVRELKRNTATLEARFWFTVNNFGQVSLKMQADRGTTLSLKPQRWRKKKTLIIPIVIGSEGLIRYSSSS